MVCFFSFKTDVCPLQIDLNDSDSPFWDPPEPVKTRFSNLVPPQRLEIVYFMLVFYSSQVDIGTCFVFTSALTHLVEVSKAFVLCSRNSSESTNAKLNFSMYE